MFPDSMGVVNLWSWLLLETCQKTIFPEKAVTSEMEFWLIDRCIYLLGAIPAPGLSHATLIFTLLRLTAGRGDILGSNY